MSVQKSYKNREFSFKRKSVSKFQEACGILNLLLLLLLLFVLDDDEDLDKFGHALDSGQDLSNVVTSSKTDSKSASDEVQWEFKWENTDNAALYGPYGTQQMADWKEQG